MEICAGSLRIFKGFECLLLQANDEGDHFPIWGTCQGFQQMSVLTANKNLLTLTNTKAVALPLTLSKGRAYPHPAFTTAYPYLSSPLL